MIRKGVGNVAEFKIEPFPFLWGRERYFGDNYLEIISDQSIVSMAITRGDEEKFSTQFTNIFGNSPPKPGKFVNSIDNDYKFLWMSPDQIFALFKRENLYPETKIQKLMGDSGFYTDQTDNWCQIKLTGPHLIQVFERICPLDLNMQKFSVGNCARTIMEHLSTIIVHDSEEGFLVLSPSSSSESFLEVIEQSFINTGDY